MNRVERLAQKLETLRRLDRRKAVFGAKKHRYKTIPWSTSRLEDLERDAGHTLPDTLRCWLLSVGSGPGPVYELCPTSGALDDDPEKDDTFADDFDQLCDITNKQLQGLIDQSLYRGPDKSGYYDVPTIRTRMENGGRGLLSLGFAGCSYDYVMPLYGELRGKVFHRTDETLDDHNIEFGGVLWPEGLHRMHPCPGFRRSVYSFKPNATEIFGFLDLIENWLNESLSLVEHYEVYQRENFDLHYQPPGLLARCALKLRFW